MNATYSNIFKATDAITHEQLTILVDAFTPLGGEPIVLIKTLEGEYETREEFEDAREYTLKGWERGYTRDEDKRKLYTSITLRIPETRHLVKSLKEALKTYEEDS